MLGDENLTYWIPTAIAVVSRSYGHDHYNEGLI
jgi:hypothetical protein